MLLFLGNRDGTFQTPKTVYTYSSFNPQILAADFNGDGIPDLIVLDNDYAVVSLGNGDGTFKTLVKFALSIGPFAIAVGDFNGDGIPDLSVYGVDRIQTNLKCFWVTGTGHSRLDR